MARGLSVEANSWISYLLERSSLSGPSGYDQHRVTIPPAPFWLYTGTSTSGEVAEWLKALAC